jgi:hypothetical protein
MLDVEPFPRMKLMKLYYLTLDEIKDLPDKYGKSQSLLSSLKLDETYQLMIYRIQILESRSY